MKHQPLAGKHALVTGAGSGIGAAIALALSEAGAKVSLVGRKRAALETQATKLSGQTHLETCDITQPLSVNMAFESAAIALGRIDILVNNAGQAESQPFGRTSLELWHRMLEVNLTGTFLCTQAALPGMLESGWGRVVNVVSTAGLKGYPYVSAYCAAKHGVIGLTRALALELARKNITVNAVCPGYTDTEMVETAIANIVAQTGRSTAEAKTELTKHNPQGRLVESAEVAASVLMFCLPSSASLTGQALAVAGGEVMP